jgi:hypothetical protein
MYFILQQKYLNDFWFYFLGVRDDVHILPQLDSFVYAIDAGVGV